MSGYFQAYLLACFLYINLSTKLLLGTLSYGLGCFPLDILPLRNYVCILKLNFFTLLVFLKAV